MLTSLNSPLLQTQNFFIMVIANLSDDLILYPGHDYGSSPTSTIGKEKQTNPVMQNITEAEFIQRMGG